MRAVLISRPTFSGGEELASCLAGRLGVPCVSRADLVRLVDRRGACAQRVVASLSRASHAYQQFSRDRRPFVVLMRRALLEMVRRHDLVYHGHACHFLVPDLPCSVTVRVNAREPLRVRRAAERLELSEEEALEVIRREDEARVRWARFLYGKDLRDATLYDLCVCLDTLPRSAVCTMLEALFHAPELAPTARQRQRLEDLYVAACVEETLVLHPETRHLEIAAAASRGEVRLTGPYLDPAVRRDVEAIAGSVEGVRSVRYEVGYEAAFGPLGLGDPPARPCGDPPSAGAAGGGEGAAPCARCSE